MRHMAVVIALIVGTAACTPDPVTATTSTVNPTTTGGPTTTLTGEVAGLVFIGGPVITMDPTRPTAEAVAINGNRIVAVGSASEMEGMIGDETLVIDLEGRALIPGFVDSHSHYYGALFAEGGDPRALQDHMLSVGVTSVGEAGANVEQLAQLRALSDEGALLVRTSAYLTHDNACGEESGDWILDVTPSRESEDRLHVGGVKVFTDGGSCNVPAVSYEYEFGGMGDLYYEADQVAEIVMRYQAVGFQVIIHAAGDRAVEATLDGLEIAIGESGNPLRHRIEHNSVVRPEMRDRYDQVGAVPVLFGSFLTCAFLGLDPRFRFRTPIENQEWEWPWRDLLDQNPATVFAWHADYPVFPQSTPIASLGGFVTRFQTMADGTECEPEPYHLKHAVTVEEALTMMTIGSAYALHRDDIVGSIEVGKLADLVVLSADPRMVPPRELFDLEVEMTVLDGGIVHCAGGLAPLCQASPPEPETSNSLATNPPGYAVDGDPETHWSSGDGAPQWIEISLGREVEVTGLRLTVDQYPSGQTRHLIWGRTQTGDLILLTEVAGVTDMFDVLEVTAGEPWLVIGIRVETVESPSWVAWREIEILSR